jgi:acyl transferase domain-containing protein
MIKQILFVFTGQGAQYFAMGRELLKENALFFNSMKECEAVIKYVFCAGHWQRSITTCVFAPPNPNEFTPAHLQVQSCIS